ncbi:hypothetical protein MAR_034879, partial [Mya arenaria]
MSTNTDYNLHEIVTDCGLHQGTYMYMTRIIRLRSMSESTADRSEFSDFRHHWHAAVGLLFAAEVFAVCLQEVHVHGQELRPLHRHFELPIILTAADTISLLILLKVECADGLKKHSEGLIIAINVVSIPVEHKHNVIISMAGALVLFCIIGLYFQTFSN